MVSVTLSVPEETREKMDKFPEINWSEVARQSINQKIRDMEFLESFKEESDLTREEAIEMGRELNEKLSDHYED
ncbi:MAG: hypothetical protein ABEJ95_03855 [Candidatus Nanohalobium sp.]